MPPAADQTPSPAPTPATAYGLYDREPIRTPGGGLIMPDLPPEAHAKQAHKDRLNDSAAWAELVLQDWFKRIAVFSVSAQFDIDRFERATQALWRLTAVAKSVFAFDESNPGTPPASSLGPRTSTSASPSPVSSPDHDQENPSSQGPQTASSADAPISNPEPPTPTIPTADSPSPSPSPCPSPSPRSALHTPHLSAPAVRAVPACPTLSLTGIETFLSRANADLAEARRPTPPILPTSHNLPPAPPSPSSLESLASLPSNSSFSALRTPHSALECPQPKARKCPWIPANLRPG